MTMAVDLRHRGIRQATLPKWAVAATTVGAVLLTLLLFATTGFQGQADFLVVAVTLAVAAIAVLSWRVEGRRRAVDRLATNLALVALLLTLLPLGFVVGYVIKRGSGVLGWGFLTHDVGSKSTAIDRRAHRSHRAARDGECILCRRRRDSRVCHCGGSSAA